MLLRVLLCLPETANPSIYAPIVKAILSGDTPFVGGEGGTVDLPTSFPGISEKSARRKVEKLPSFPFHPIKDGDRRDLVASYLLQRSRNIDSETGALSIVKELLFPFQMELPRIKRYLVGAVEVLSRLVYEYALEEDEGVGGLAAFETLGADVGVRILLNHCGKGNQIVRDLETLVVPYLNYKENDVAGWCTIWAWLGEKVESGDWVGFVEVITKWSGPAGNEALREQYARFAIAGCYICRETGNWVWEGMRAVQKRALGFVEAGMGAGGNACSPPTKLGGLLDKENPLTAPNVESLRLLDLLITSAGILSLPLAVAAKVKLEGSHEDQKALLVRYVRGGPNWTKRSDDEWKKIKDGVRWMRTKSRVFGKLAAEEVEKVLLSGMLAATRFGLVKEIYVNGRGGLSREDIERRVLDAFQEFYDNASNGNKTRGSIKNALSAYVSFPSFSPFELENLTSDSRQSPDTLPPSLRFHLSRTCLPSSDRYPRALTLLINPHSRRPTPPCPYPNSPRPTVSPCPSP